MMNYFIHYTSAALALGIAALGGGIGQGIAGYGVLEAMNRQPASHASNFRALIIGLALIESGIVITLVTTLMTILGTNPSDISLGGALAELGMGIAVGCAGGAVSIASSFIVQAAAQAIARQPFFSSKIITLMLLTQSIVEAPVIFGFIVALLIKGKLTPHLEIFDGLKCLAVGIATGLGSIGPSVGQALFASSACKAVGINKNAFSRIFPFTLLNTAIIETPLIFCLLVGLLMLYQPSPITSVFKVTSLLAAAITIALGSLGTSTGIGLTASKSVIQMAYQLQNAARILRTSILAQAFIESSIIYAMIVALILIMR